METCTYWGMMNIRCYYIPDAIVFITQVVAWRTPIFTETRFVVLCRSVLQEVKKHHPFDMVGYVILPDHFHLMLRPIGKSNFSDIMHSLKRNYTLEYKKVVGINGRMKFWQKGFWDHVIRNEIDFERHLDYIHYNPVHHGFADKPEVWPHSSYVHWQERGVYPNRWGWSLPASLLDQDWTGSEADHDW
jgi:putative transposase